MRCFIDNLKWGGEKDREVGTNNGKPQPNTYRRVLYKAVYLICFLITGIEVNKVFSSKSNQAVAGLFQNSQCSLMPASYQLRAFALTGFDSA